MVHCEEDTGPVYEHDCQTCVYLGTTGPTKGYPQRNAVDHYFHKEGEDCGTVIQRGGSRGEDYRSWRVEWAKDNPLWEPTMHFLVKEFPEFSLAH